MPDCECAGRFLETVLLMHHAATSDSTSVTRTTRYPGHPLLRGDRIERMSICISAISRPEKTESKSMFATTRGHRELISWLSRNSHIFDGKTVSKETAAFQLCDIVDPMLKEMIEDPDALRETCDVRTPHICGFSPCSTLDRNATDGTRLILSKESSPSSATSSSRSLKDIPPQMRSAEPC
jgi:hypothetical protein